MTNNVSHPAHYTYGDVECIDAIRSALGDGFASYLHGNVLKYVWRWKHKGGLEDLLKAQWHLSRLIAEVDNNGGAGHIAEAPYVFGALEDDGR